MNEYCLWVFVFINEIFAYMRRKIKCKWFYCLFTVGAEADDEKIEFLLSEVNGKDITELIASGRERLASVPAGGGAVAFSAPAGGAGGAAAPAAAAESKKEEKVEEKEESDDVSFVIE